MKKLIIIFGMLLMSASALADHTSGLKQHQAGKYGASVDTGGSVGVVTPKAGLFLNQSSARQPNIITDPVSCVEKWGDACLETDEQVVVPTLDLGDTNVQEHMVPFEDGESIDSILDEVLPEASEEAKTEASDDFVGPLPE